MVGAGTARADLPSLNVRDLGMDHQPIRVVLSSGLDLPQTGPLFDGASAESPVWIMCGTLAPSDAQTAWQQAGAELMVAETEKVSIEAALKQLAQAGITRVFCEGGGKLAASLLQADRVDRLVIFSAGMALGADARPGLGRLGIDDLQEAKRFHLHSQRRIGDDVQTEWRRS